MNVVNRVGLSLVLLIVAVCSLMLALYPASLVVPLRFALAAAEHTEPFDQLFNQVTLSISALVVAVVALVLLFAEWRRPTKRDVLVTRLPGGTAELARESVAFRLKRAAEAVPGIREATPVIQARGDGVDVMLRLAAEQDVDLPVKSREVMDAVRTEAEQKMGVKVKSLRVTFRHATGGSRLPARPVEAPPPGPPSA